MGGGTDCGNVKMGVEVYLQMRNALAKMPCGIWTTEEMVFLAEVLGEARDFPWTNTEKMDRLHKLVEKSKREWRSIDD